MTAAALTISSAADDLMLWQAARVEEALARVVPADCIDVAVHTYPDRSEYVASGRLVLRVRDRLHMQDGRAVLTLDIEENPK